MTTVPGHKPDRRKQHPVDYCRTRTVLRAVVVGLWLALCLSLFSASGLRSLWQHFTATSLFLMWTVLLLSLLLCLAREPLRRYRGLARLWRELAVALAVVLVNSALAWWLLPGHLLDQFGPGWFLLRNVGLAALLMPWLLRHPWLAGTTIPTLEDGAQLLAEAAEQAPGAEDELLIKSQGNLLRINLSEVRYFYADNKYVTARGPQREYIVDQSLKQLEDRFGRHVFRVHRGYLLVTAFIRGVQTDALGRTEVIVQDLDERVPVSRRYTPALRQFLKRVVGE